MTTTQVSRAAGVSLRQLQWWDERGIVSPRQNGHNRVYDEVAVRRALLVAALRKKGISLMRSRAVLQRALHAQPGDILVIYPQRIKVCHHPYSAFRAALLYPGSVIVVSVR